MVGLERSGLPPVVRQRQVFGVQVRLAAVEKRIPGIVRDRTARRIEHLAPATAASVR